MSDAVSSPTTPPATDADGKLLLAPDEARALLRECCAQFQTGLVDVLTASIDGTNDLFEQNKFVSDAEILAWVEATSRNKPTAVQIAAWSALQEQRVPTDLESRQTFNDYHAKLAPHREDIATWFDVLDLDDFVTFGGKP